MSKEALENDKLMQQIEEGIDAGFSFDDFLEVLKKLQKSDYLSTSSTDFLPSETEKNDAGKIVVAFNATFLQEYLDSEKTDEENGASNIVDAFNAPFSPYPPEGRIFETSENDFLS